MADAGAPLIARLQADQAAARKALEKDRVMLLGVTISEARNREIELRRELTDEDVIDVIRKGIKKRRESVELYAKAGRTDLADKEQAELVLLEQYLPAQVDVEELRAAVREAIASGAANIGAVMARVMPKFKGRAEGGTINALAREELTKV